jgi:outer membrane lipoprotein-sorting protein
VRDTAFLVWSPRDAQGEVSQWIYLVGQRKVRRVAAGARNNAFLGTDFTFEDLTERSAGQDRHALLRTERLGSRQHYVVESVPRAPDAPYGRRVQWVDPEGWTVSQIEFYSRENELEKTLRSDWSRIGEAWIAVRLEMQNHRNGHRTLIEVSDLRVDSGLDAELFAASRLPGANR